MKRRGRVQLFLLIGSGVGCYYLADARMFEAGRWVRMTWRYLEGLPQLLWWYLGGGVLSIWTLTLLVSLARQRTAPINPSRSEELRAGRLQKVHSLLERAEASLHAYEQTTALLRSVAIDLIALKRDASDEAARQRLNREEPDEEAALRPLFTEAPPGANDARSDHVRRLRLRPSTLLDDIETKLDVLDAYSGFTRAKGNL